MQSKKQTVMAGIMKKPMIRAIRKYRMNCPLMEAITIGLLSYLKKRSCRITVRNLLFNRYWTFSESPKNRILLFKIFSKRIF